MKLEVLLVLTCVWAKSAWTLPIAQDPNDQVELVPSGAVTAPFPVEEDKDEAPVFVFTAGNRGGNGEEEEVPLITSGFLPFFETILRSSFDHQGNDDDEDEDDIIPALFPRFPAAAAGGIEIDIGEDQLFPQIGGIFGGGNDNGESCGAFCKLFSSLGRRMKDIEDQLREIQAHRENELDVSSSSGEEAAEKPEPKTVYEEKVLPDGTVVKIKKTYYSDTSDDGSAYFGYHSTRVVASSASDDEDKPEVTSQDELEGDEVEQKEDEAQPIKLIVDDQENDSMMIQRRLRRSPEVQSTVADPFNQQVEDVSFLNQINQRPFNQVPAAFPFAPAYPGSRTMTATPGFPAFPTLPPTLTLRSSSGGAASTGRARPVSLAGDTRVNDLLLQNARRGGLVRLEPDAEIFDREAVLNTQG